MEDNVIDLDYLDRAIGCVVGQLEYLIDKIGEIDYKYVDDLSLLTKQYEDVENDEQYQKLSAEFSDLRSKVIKDSLFKDNREIFLVSTEIDYLNNFILTLLNNNQGSHTLTELTSETLNKFHLTIREILTINDKVNLLDKQAVEILKILANEKKYDDIEEGINLVVSLTQLNLETSLIYEKIAQAHILAVYYDILKQKD